MLTLEPKAFLSKIPVLLLMAAIVSAVLMYLAMMWDSHSIADWV